MSDNTLSGVLVQLSGKGVQNIYLDLSPQYTFFKRSFRRHTNYAVQAIVVAASNQVGFAKNITFPIPRNGDLLAETYLCAYLPCCGVDTTNNMYVKAQRGVVTSNSGFVGSAFGQTSNQLTHPTHAKSNFASVDIDKMYTATGEITDVGLSAATTANTYSAGSMSASVQEQTQLKRVQGKSGNGYGNVNAPRSVKTALPTGIGATAQTALNNKAAAFMTGDDHANVGYVNALGHAMIDTASFSVGGNTINSFSGEYMHIWHLMNNPQGDRNSCDNLFFYGDSVGAPMAENGTSAPHAFIEKQSALHNEIGQYKLAKIDLKLPKVISSGFENLPAYKKPAWKMAVAERPTMQTLAAAADASTLYSTGLMEELDRENGKAISSAPIIQHGDLLPLRFLKLAGAHDPTKSNYITDRDRAKDGVTTTYRVSIVDSTGKCLDRAVARAIIVGQAGSTIPLGEAENIYAADNLESRIAMTTNNKTLARGIRTAMDAVAYADCLPWSQSTFDAQAIGTCQPKNFQLGMQDDTGDLANGQASYADYDKTLTVAQTLKKCVYAPSDQMYRMGRPEVRDLVLGTADIEITKAMYQSAADGAGVQPAAGVDPTPAAGVVAPTDVKELKDGTLKHVNLPWFYMHTDNDAALNGHARYKTAAGSIYQGSVSTKEWLDNHRDYKTTDFVAATKTAELFKLCFGTYKKTHGRRGEVQYKYDPDCFGTYVENFSYASHSAAAVYKTDADGGKSLVTCHKSSTGIEGGALNTTYLKFTSDSGFEGIDDANIAEVFGVGFGNPKNIQAMEKLAQTLTSKFGRWFTCEVVKRSGGYHPAVGGKATVYGTAGGNPTKNGLNLDFRKRKGTGMKQRLTTTSGTHVASTFASDATSGGTYVALKNVSNAFKDGTKCGLASTTAKVDENREGLTKLSMGSYMRDTYALRFTGTRELRETYGRLEVSIFGKFLPNNGGATEKTVTTKGGILASTHHVSTTTYAKLVRMNTEIHPYGYASGLTAVSEDRTKCYNAVQQLKAKHTSIGTTLYGMKGGCKQSNAGVWSANANFDAFLTTNIKGTGAAGVLTTFEQNCYYNGACNLSHATGCELVSGHPSHGNTYNDQLSAHMDNLQMVLTASVGTPDYVPQGAPSPDSIQFVVYNRVGPSGRVADYSATAVAGDTTCIVPNAKVIFEKVSDLTTSTYVFAGSRDSSKRLVVQTCASTQPIAYTTASATSKRTSLMTTTKGLKAATKVFNSSGLEVADLKASSYGFVKDQVRHATLKNADLTVDGIQLLGPLLVDNAYTLDLQSFYEAATKSRVVPLSGRQGAVSGTNRANPIDATSIDNSGRYYGGAGTEFDSAYSLHSTDAVAGSGAHESISILTLCTDLVGGKQLHRASDAGAVGSNSFGYNTNWRASATANASDTTVSVSNMDQTTQGTANLARYEKARRTTMQARKQDSCDFVRGHDQQNYLASGATDDIVGYTHTNSRHQSSDHSKVSSNAGPVLHDLATDFITTSSYANGTVSLSFGSKKAHRDGFAKRCYMSSIGNADHPEGTGRCVKVMVPLPFWYTRHGNQVSDHGRTQVLPIIALQYHDCKVNIKLRAQADLVQTDHEARNMGLRCSSVLGLNGCLARDGRGAQLLHSTRKTSLQTFLRQSVATPATMNGGFQFSDMVGGAERLTFAGNSVGYGTQLAAWGNGAGNGNPRVAGENAILQASKTGQMMATDLGARSHSVPSRSGTASALVAAGGDPGALIDAFLLCQTIFLDSNERRLFASHTHEYLITQVQMQEFAAPPQTRPEFQLLQASCRLNFNHPVSQIYWVLQRPESRATRNWFRYEATHMGGDDIMVKAQMRLNSHGRESGDVGDSMFGRVIQPQTYMGTVPAGGVGANLSDAPEGGAKNIYMYSFAQHPKEWWPSGNLNMSRIDTAQLNIHMKGHASQAHVGHQYTYAGGGFHQLADEIEFVRNVLGDAEITSDKRNAMYYGTFEKGVDIRVYVQSFNIARIMSGMMALKYAN